MAPPSCTHMAGQPSRLCSRNGFSLVELMITLVVASLLGMFVLALGRSQLSSFRVSEETQRVQQNARAGFAFLEPFLRDACASIRSGSLFVNLGPRDGGAPTSFQTTCVRMWSGRIPAEGNATADGGSFISYSATGKREHPDALEVVYGTNRGVATAVVPAGHIAGTGLSLQVVTDTTGFRPGDYLLLTNDHVSAQLVGPVATVDAASRTITTETLHTAVAPGSINVLTARTVAFYIGDLADNETTSDLRDGVLMYDPDGLAGATHADAVPLVDGAEDFQVAVGDDARPCPSCLPCNGILEASDGGAPLDQWYGNDPDNDEPLPSPNADAGAPSWYATNCNPATPPPVAMRAIRASLVLRTRREFPSTQPAGPMAIEDRRVYPVPVTSHMAPKVRALQIEVMPRTWNLNE